MENGSADDLRAGPWSLAEAAAAWATTHRVPVGQRDVRYREAGAGPVLVLVHGLGVSADYWVRNGPPIAASGFRVLAPDLPGFGRTAGPDGGLDVHAQADALGKWLDALGIAAATLLGHSLSCQTTIELAATRGGLVSALILAAPTGDGHGRRRLARQLLGLVRDVPRESFPFAVLVLQAYARAGPLRVLRTWRLGAEHDPIGPLATVSVPGIVILGKRDPVVNLDFAKRLAALLEGGRVVLVPGPHGVIFDETGEFNRVVVEFLNEVRGKR